MSLTAFVAQELAPSRRRIVEATRNATKATFTTGLAAIMQIVGPFGPLFAFRIGQPGVSLGLFEGTVTIACAAATQTAIVPITGKLLDYPGLIIAFLFTTFAALGYLLSNTRFFLPLALVAIGTITTVYVGIFEPGGIGWGSAYTFSGILVATLVMVALDTLIWPSPPEPRLLESVAADLTATRRRLALLGRRYLDPSSTPLPLALVKSKLAPTLAVLNSVKEHTNPTPQRLGALLDAILSSERIYVETERLALLADEPASDEIRQKHGENIRSSLATIDAAIANEANRMIAGLPDIEETPNWVKDLRLTIQSLSELNRRTALATERSYAPETLNFLGLVGGLEAIARLLDPLDRPQRFAAAAEADELDHDPQAPPLIDPARVRFSIKLGATITLGLIVGLTTQRADLQTILWSIVVAGQPNQYGAVVRKTALRILGCLMGGVAALAAMIIVSQNFDSLPPYLIAIFAVTLLSAYVAQSSEWLGYAGIQTGMTFLICYVGLAPSSDIYKPLWRFWGIVLGVLTTGFVFLFLLPEYATDKVIASLEKLTRATLALGEEVAEKSVTEGRIAAVERRLSSDLLEVLNIADQARLEGRPGATSSAAAVEAADLLIRIAYRFETIAYARLKGSEVDQPEEMRQRCTHLERQYCSLLQSGLAKLKSGEISEPSSTATPQSLPSDAMPTNDKLMNMPLLEETERMANALGNWPPLEAYRRMPILLSQLDSAFGRIANS